MKTVAYTHLRKKKTTEHIVCRLLLEKKNQFKEINTQEGIDEHVARINGYAYALVNMDVITEETANTQVAYAACAAAAARQEELERLKGKWQ